MYESSTPEALVAAAAAETVRLASLSQPHPLALVSFSPSGASALLRRLAAETELAASLVLVSFGQSTGSKMDSYSTRNAMR